MKTRFIRTWLLMLAIATLAIYSNQAASTVSLHNQSGELALVKLVGPTAQEVEVPYGQIRITSVAAGEYYLLARYGADPRGYTYLRGDPFQVQESATQYSAIKITLHKVIGGQYGTRAIKGEEFEQAGGVARPTSSDSRAMQQKEASKPAGARPATAQKAEAKEGDFSTGKVVYQGVSFDQQGQPDAILFRLSGNNNVEYRASLADANRLGLAVKGRIRIFRDANVEVHCKEAESNAQKMRSVSSLKWIDKLPAPEGELYRGTVSRTFMQNYQEKVAFFMTLSEHPNLEFWFKGTPFKTDEVNWFGVMDDRGVLRVGEGDKVQMTAIKQTTSGVWRVTSFGRVNQCSEK